MLTSQRKILSTKEREKVLEQLRDALLAADQDITDILLIGSSVYAPNLAGDIDLLVMTRQKKDYAIYCDAVDRVWDNVDVVVMESGESMGWDFTWSVRAFHRVLYGSDEWIEEVIKDVQPLSWDWARVFFQVAESNLNQGNQAINPMLKDAFYRDAFDGLFEVARRAAMVFLNTQEGRWGKLRNMLPPPFDQRFDDIIRTVHIEYWYLGNYATGQVDTEFQRWRQIVEQLVNDLEQASRSP